MTDRSDSLILAECEAEMAEVNAEVLRRAARDLKLENDATEAGRAMWVFVDDDEPSPAETREALAAFQAFPVRPWWRRDT